MRSFFRRSIFSRAEGRLRLPVSTELLQYKVVFSEISGMYTVEERKLSGKKKVVCVCVFFFSTVLKLCYEY